MCIRDSPCISICSGRRVEKIKTYLKGTWQNYNLIVIPSFTQISYGSDILHEKTISPFIEDINNFEVIAVEEGDIYPLSLIHISIILIVSSCVGMNVVL